MNENKGMGDEALMQVVLAYFHRPMARESSQFHLMYGVKPTMIATDQQISPSGMSITHGETECIAASDLPASEIELQICQAQASAQTTLEYHPGEIVIIGNGNALKGIKWPAFKLVFHFAS